MSLRSLIVSGDLVFHLGLAIFLTAACELDLGDASLLSIYSPTKSILDLVLLSFARYGLRHSTRWTILSLFLSELKLVVNLLTLSTASVVNDYSAICLLSFLICCARFTVDRSTTAHPPISWTRLFRFAKGHWTRLLVGILVLVVRLPFALAVPHYVSECIGALIQRDLERLEYACTALFIAGTVDAALDFWCVYVFATAQQEIVFSLRSTLFRSILFHPLKFFDVSSVGELQSRLNADTAEMANDLSWVFRFAIEALVRVTGVLGYMFFCSWRLTVLVLFIVPLNAVANTYFGQWRAANAKAAQDLLAESNSVANESFGSIQTVKSFHGEQNALSQYSYSLERYKALQYKAAVVSAVYYMLVSTFLTKTLMQTCIMGYGGMLAWHELIATERLVAFLLYRNQLQDYFASLMDTYVNLVKCAGVSDRVFDLISGTDMETAEDEIISSESDLAGHALVPPRVEFKNVTMRYSNRNEILVLNSVSFVVKSGSCTSIVGHSGSGKSSVLSLLLRLYSPQSGAITINKSNVSSIPIKTLRGRLVSIVSQEPVLFRGTLRDNILYSLSAAQRDALSPSTVDELLKRAISIAYIAEFVASLPDQLDTKIGDRGVTLSGGQKQRIAIARAIVSNPPILLLDEAMSALDPESEESVQKALSSAMKARTTIMVSHRISSVIDVADHCIVLHKGEVVQQGHPRDLLNEPPGPAGSMSLKLLYDIQQRSVL